MAIDQEEASPKSLGLLSAELAAMASANAKLLLPSGADKEMKKLSESIQQTSVFLKDAEAKSERKSAWFRELRDIVHEIHTILQLFSPINNHDEIPNRSVNSKTTIELKSIRTRLDKILKKQNIASHHPSTDHATITKMSIANCPLEPLVLRGGKSSHQEKEMIISLLLSVQESKQSAPCIIPIDRKGGTGTTELTRAIFDDKRVQNHFVKRKWADAPENVDFAMLSELISKPASTLFWVHKTLAQNREEEQQLLLVLDDIDRITKHSNMPQNKEEPSSFRHAKSSSSDESWALLREHAIPNGYTARHLPELEAIGRKIAESIPRRDFPNIGWTL